MQGNVIRGIVKRGEARIAALEAERDLAREHLSQAVANVAELVSRTDMLEHNFRVFARLAQERLIERDDARRWACRLMAERDDARKEQEGDKEIHRDSA